MIEHLIKHLPRFTTATQEIVKASLKLREKGPGGDVEAAEENSGFECVICLEKCVAHSEE